MNKRKEILNILVLIGWALGNMMIFSAIIYISYNIANKGEIVDNIFVAIIMILWVLGQFRIKSVKGEKYE